MSSQKDFDEGVSSHSHLMGKFCRDEELPEKLSTLLFIRKFWYRMKLFSLQQKLKLESEGKEGDVVAMVLGGGKDTICRNFKDWKVIRMDKEKYDHSIQCDLDKEIDNVEKMIASEGVKVVIMEGLIYYLEMETIKRLLEIFQKYKIYYIFDGCDSKTVTLCQQFGLKFKTAIPLELLPEGSKVISGNDMMSIYGKSHFFKPAVDIDAQAYYICNF